MHIVGAFALAGAVLPAILSLAPSAISDALVLFIVAVFPNLNGEKNFKFSLKMLTSVSPPFERYLDFLLTWMFDGRV